MKPDIFIRTDASPDIGLGHLVRCSALAHMLKKEFEITFFCKSIPVSIEKEFRDNGFNIVHIFLEDDFYNAIKPGGIIVLDGYNFSTDYQKMIKRKGAKLVCIDDLHDKEYIADLIINHAPGIVPWDYRAKLYTQFALGPDYVLLRPAFLKQAKKNRIIDKIKTVLICFGGSDPNNLTSLAIKVVSEFKEFIKVIVVTGHGFIKTEYFDQILLNDHRIDYRSSLNENEMLDAMLEAELAILPASGILLEALAAGCKVIAGTYVENQKYLLEYFAKEGQIIYADTFEPQKLRHSIQLVLHKKFNARNVIDGNTKKRLIKYFRYLSVEDLFILRTATVKDLKKTYYWAINPDIRKYSFQKHRITRDEHKNWFLKKIEDTSCFYFICEYKKKPIGSIRFDIENQDAVISYLVDPEFQGQGLGLILLKKGIESILLKNHNADGLYSISGYVMKTNIPSIKAFKRMGFMEMDIIDRYKFEKKI